MAKTKTPVTASEVDATNVKLKKQLVDTQRRLDDAREKTVDYVAALRAAVFEAAEYRDIEVPKARRAPSKSRKNEEIAVIDISDLQLGKETPSYDTEVCRRRMRELAQDVIRIASIQNAEHPVRKLHIHLLGDIVEGESIFPGQAHQIHAGLYRQILDAQDILVDFILDVLQYFDSVHVVGVIGNHGNLKMRGEVDPETNMDRLVYSITKKVFKGNPRVTWNIPEGRGQRNWYAVNRIFDWGFLLAHGDQIKGQLSIPFYGALKKAFGWIDAIDEPWDFLHIGHHHTPAELTYNRRLVVFNGTTESGNEFAQELLAAVGHPTQWLGFVHPKHGITARYWVHLEDKQPNLQRYKEYH